ncbi:MAG TPA: tRNA pseudouridine(55) synthase TruB [Bacteroidia bacterium]|nr:tRNA pseudouridine(55) synthase TruB [Bacteroidia bacterium]
MTEKKPFDFVAGEVLLIDKLQGWTSFDAVNRIRSMIKRHLNLKVKVGHAGTLDPLATGLLILCTGKFTKRIEEFQAQEKEYTGTFVVGATTPSFDLEHEVNEHFPVAHITDEMIRAATKKFLGETEQVPPMFSAIKVEGKRAYELARKGEGSVIPPRKITITGFEITGIERSEADDAPVIAVHFRVSCSKGTYIRSLARDFGRALDSGAYLSALRRTRIGEFRIEDAMTIDQLGLKVMGRS